jgi:hypothetical protein
VPGAQLYTINKPVSYAMKITLVRSRYRWEIILELIIRNGCKNGAEIVWLRLVSNGRSCENGDEPLDFIKVGRRWGVLY